MPKRGGSARVATIKTKGKGGVVYTVDSTGHRDVQTTQRYADYAPNAHEAELVEAAFASGSVRGPIHGPNLSESGIA